MATFKDFRNSVKPNWCPGCGDFSVQAAIQRAAANVGYEPHELAIISGIGCSGRISGYTLEFLSPISIYTINVKGTITHAPLEYDIITPNIKT